MAPGGDLQSMERLERLLLDPQVRRSPDAVAALLADDFAEVTRSGWICRRNEVIRHLASEGGRTNLAAYGFELVRLAEDVALLTYRTTRASGDGAEIRTLRSSIWRRTGDRWRMVFHQGTPAAP